MGEPVYDGPRHFDYKPLRTEDIERGLGVRPGQSGAVPRPAGEVEGVPRDPEVQEALTAARVGELPEARSATGRRTPDLIADRTAFEEFDLALAREQGYGFAKIQRLAIEHLLGVR